MRDILKRIFIGVAIGMALFFLKSHVFAATVSVSNSQFQYTRHYCLAGEVGCSDFYVSGYSPYGTWLTMPTQPSGVTINRYYLVATYSQHTATLQTGNTYTVIFRTQLDPKDNALDHVNSLQYNIYGKVGSNFSDNYISTQSCSTRNVVTHDYAIETTCVFQVNTNCTGFLIRSVYSLTKTPNRLTMSNVQAFSSQNEVGAINELTNVFKQMTAILINNFNISTDKIIDTDSDPDWTVNNDYSTDDYDDVESDLHNLLEDSVDPDGLTIDFTQWHNPFSWIFLKLTQFVQLNGKVFAMITAFLTLSFVGLVFNR